MEWTVRLKKIMKDKHVNIEQLKSKIEQNGHSLSRNSIGNILNGKNSPKIETLQVIANALKVDMTEIFSTSESGDTNINGFIETKDKIYKIKSLKDLKQLLQDVDKSTDDSNSAFGSESLRKKSFYGSGIQHYAVRGGARKKSVKLTRNSFKKYNITICNKKEFIETPNELSRDIKIWVFQSKDDVQSAKAVLEKQLNFKFNE